MSFVKTLTFQFLVDLILEAKTRVYLSMPGLDTSLVAVLTVRQKELDIKVLLDNSEETIRNGYGEALGILKAREAGIEIRECEGNMVSFILVDNSGYFLFPQSKFFADEPSGPNGVQFDPVTAQFLLQYFFKGSESEENMRQLLGQSATYFEKAAVAIRENGTEIDVKNFNEKRFEAIQENLKKNPPLQPDIKRILEVYTTKLQYVDLVAKNIKINQHRASLPEDSIPVRDKELRKRLISSIKAFENMERSIEVLELQILEVRLKKLRKNYLIPITCRNGRNLIKKEKITEFRSKVEALDTDFKNITERLGVSLFTEIEKTKTMLRTEWQRLFKSNPPEELKGLNKKSEEFQKRLGHIVDLMVDSVKFPPVEKIMNEFSVNIFYFELTWDDLKDEKLIDELCSKRIITKGDQKQLADFKLAMVSKNEPDLFLKN